jgi:hypothetical protein
MYVCTRMYVGAYVRACIYLLCLCVHDVNVRIYLPMYVLIHVCMCICMCMYIHAYVCMYVYTYACVRVVTWIFMETALLHRNLRACVRIYIYIYIYIYIHTHTHEYVSLLLACERHCCKRRARMHIYMHMHILTCLSFFCTAFSRFTHASLDASSSSAALSPLAASFFLPSVRCGGMVSVRTHMEVFLGHQF